MKARKLKALVEWLGERDDDIEALMADDTAALREELLGIHGIGEETADDILLYALDMPVFVIDHYTKRLLFPPRPRARKRARTPSTTNSSRRASQPTSRSSTSTTP